MGDAVKDVDREQLAFDESLLATLKTRRNQLSRQRTAACAAVAQAQATLVAVSEELGVVSARYESLVDQVAARRNRLRTCYMASLLPELLRTIFTVITTEYRFSVLANYGTYHSARAKQPFQLAGVSKWWRWVALSTPELWTYVAVPAPRPKTRDNGRSIFYTFQIQTVLRRSQGRPLDVHLEWSENITLDQCPYGESLLKILAKHAPRWRSFLLVLPEAYIRPTLQSALRHPMPLLEHFKITFDAWPASQEVANQSINDRDVSSARWLEHCPQLKVLVSTWTNLLPYISSTTGHPLAKLIHLTLNITTRISPHLIWNVISSAPNLERLSLEVLGTWRADVDMLPTTNIHLQRLRCLKIDDLQVAQMLSAAAGSFSVPTLAHLRVKAFTLGALRPFLELRCASTTKLTLVGNVLSSACRDLQPLRRLQRIKFANGTIEDALLQELAVPNPLADGTATEWTFPRLERMVFDEVTFIPEPNSVAAFLRARNDASLATSDGMSQPSKVSSVQFVGEFLTWLLADVKLALGQELDFDQEVASTIDGYSCGDVTSAEFTDGNEETSEDESSEGENGGDSDEDDSSYVPSDEFEDDEVGNGG